eukprot:TRINITY_DN3196_c0_g2_i12.p1 TRINITY_DN3196_c0_g2~~TRINITY_DN3196_c0_g2_i12.p1  ORF type:complete len:121 (-),score=15.81 TRINITY_DN3196_c0_g2_i12:20-382(-)
MAGLQTKCSLNWTPLEVDHLMFLMRSVCYEGESMQTILDASNSKAENRERRTKVLKPYSQTEIMGDPARKRFNKALCGARTEPKENIIGRLEAVSWKGKARREELKNQFFTNYNRAQRGQ